MVVITGTFGSVTSSPVSLISVTSSAILAFWNFDTSIFTNTAINPNCITNPTPWFGVGSTLPIGTAHTPGTSPFSGATDPADGPPFGLGTPNFSWGTSQYPTHGGNKSNGVEYAVSTVGARDITISYDCRVSATASDFERLQYTTNGGVDWVDYPISSTFNGHATTYTQFSYTLTGFPGVDNNPDFAFRVMTEFQSTATYGISANTNYLGTANTINTAGTIAPTTLCRSMVLRSPTAACRLRSLR